MASILVQNEQDSQFLDAWNKIVPQNIYNKNRNLFRIKNKLYYVINPYNNYKKRIDKGLEQASKSQKDYLDKGGDFSQLNTIGNLPDTKYTKIENFRKGFEKLCSSKT